MHPVAVLVILGAAIICALTLLVNYTVRKKDKDLEEFKEIFTNNSETNREKIYYKDPTTFRQRLLDPNDPEDAKLIHKYHSFMQQFDSQMKQMDQIQKDINNVFKVEK